MPKRMVKHRRAFRSSGNGQRRLSNCSFETANGMQGEQNSNMGYEITRHGKAHYICISKGPGAKKCRTKANSVIDDDRQRVYMKHGLAN
eukprot:989418-Heterocapsa_arctica.AAC.1